MKPERIFFSVSAVFGLLMAVLTPPFQAPDEAVHFYRAYSVAQGALLAEREAGLTGDELPVSVIEATNRFTRMLPGKPAATVSLAVIAEELDRPLNPARRRFEHFPSAATYTPVPYISQAVAIAFAAGAGAAPIELLYAARAANLLLATLIISLAIAMTPILKWQIAFVGLLPMAVFLRASASADGMTTAVVFLAVAAAARIAFGTEGAVPRKQVAVLFAALFLVPLTKALYAPVGTLALLPRHGPRRARVAAGAVIALAAGISVAMPFSGSVMGAQDFHRGVDSRAQLAYAASRPLETAGVILTDLFLHAPRYAAHFIGRLGALDTPLPLALLACYGLALLAILILSDGSPTPAQRALSAGALLLTVMGISFALYAAWTPVGATRVEGIQGRYFIPVAPLLFLAAANQRFSGWSQRPWFPRLFAGFHVAGLSATAAVLVARYYV